MNITIRIPDIKIPKIPFWGFWSPAEPAPEMSKALASLARVRGFLYDSQVDEHVELSRALGLPPISDEVSEMERSASNARVDKIAYLGPLLHTYAHTMAAAVVATFQDAAGPDKVSPEKWALLRSTLEPVAHATIIGGVSQLVDIGLLKTKEPRA